MKKKEILFIILFIAICGSIIFALHSTNKKASDNIKTVSDGDIEVEITDSYFIQATNDIYFNMDDYVGKTIRMEGLVYSYEDTEGEIRFAVVRNTPGCCGADGLAGLDIQYDKEYPAEDTWVEVIGVIEKDVISGFDTPVIKLTALAEKEEGTTFVTN